MSFSQIILALSFFWRAILENSGQFSLMDRIYAKFDTRFWMGTPENLRFDVSHIILRLLNAKL